jgi:hypothetical protein
MFEKLVEFFQKRRVTTQIQPSIAVNYDPWSYDENVKLALKEQWEGLLKELERASHIKERKWSSSFGGKRRELIKVEIDGVIIDLTGSEYPDPEWKQPAPAGPKSDTERGNEDLDQLTQNSSLLWALSHCSDRKYEAYIEFVKATRATRSERK